MTVENNLPVRIFLDVVYVLGGDMGAVQISNLNHLLIVFHPLPNAPLHLTAVKDFDAHLLQGFRVRLFLEEIVP